MNRRAFIALVIGLAIAWPLTPYGQQPKQPLKRVGVLTQYGCPLLPGNIQPDNIVVRRLGELGWIEGQTIVFDCVSAIGRIDQVPALARELVSRRPDVLIANPWLFVSALKRETTTIPIVMLATWEPLRSGLIDSFARPEGNVTGIAWLYLLPKQMEILKEIVPNLRRVAFITNLPAYAPPEVFKVAKEYQSNAASTLGFTWQLFPAVVETDYDEIFTRLAAEHFDAVYIPGLPFNTQNQTRICNLALRHRIPAISESPDWAKCGVLLSYGQDFMWTLSRAMDYVDKILRGAKPSDLPVEQATKFDLVVNLKTAKTLGLTVPPSLIARADEVIE
jgi:putative ABC transport system substrate-binding protein